MEYCHYCKQSVSFITPFRITMRNPMIFMRKTFLFCSDSCMTLAKKQQTIKL